MSWKTTFSGLVEWTWLRLKWTIMFLLSCLNWALKIPRVQIFLTHSAKAKFIQTVALLSVSCFMLAFCFVFRHPLIYRDLVAQMYFRCFVWSVRDSAVGSVLQHAFVSCSSPSTLHHSFYTKNSTPKVFINDWFSSFCVLVFNLTLVEPTLSAGSPQFDDIWPLATASSWRVASWYLKRGGVSYRREAEDL